MGEEEEEVEEGQQQNSVYGTPGGTGSDALVLALRIAGTGTPATLRVPAASGLLDVQRAVAEFLNLGSDESASIKLYAHDSDFDEEVRVTDLDQLRESFADCEIIPKGDADERLGMSTSSARAALSAEEGVPPVHTSTARTVIATHKPPGKVVRELENALKHSSDTADLVWMLRRIGQETATATRSGMAAVDKSGLEEVVKYLDALVHR